MFFEIPLRASRRSLLQPCTRRTLQRPRSAVFVLAASGCVILLSGEADAQHVLQWSRVGTVTTLTNGQLCRTDGTFIICDTNNPTIAGASLGIGTTAPQNRLLPSHDAHHDHQAADAARFLNGMTGKPVLTSRHPVTNKRSPLFV